MSDYRVVDIPIALKNIGIQKGDDIFIHSNIGFFGRMEHCTSRETLCEAFLHSILDVLGEFGTLVVPTFSYSFCHGEIFSPATTRTTCGMLSEYVMRQKNAIRSLDPNFSVAAIGKRAVYYTEHPANESFGTGCFFERFIKKNGKIICMNYDAGSTFVHYIERKNNVSYRYNKAFNGIIENDNVQIRDYFVHYVYDLDKKEDAPDTPSIHTLCEKNKILKKTFLGKGTILAMESQIYYKTITAELKRNPRFMTVGK